MPAPDPLPISFDARPLADPVDPRAVRAFSAEMRARGSSMTATRIVMIVVISVIGVVFLGILLPSVALLASSAGRGVVVLSPRPSRLLSPQPVRGREQHDL